DVEGQELHVGSLVKNEPLSLTLKIMSFMVKDNHLDPGLFRLFVESKIWLEYARKYLSEDQIDDVDIDAILAQTPKPFELPPEQERAERREGFRPEYAAEAERLPELATLMEVE
ncbi:MAG: hypothetical protein KJO07_17620, partial [Deltaproteobacteria bacterium]|nr:hypothetical protein [Deltaproteobacteria bacterium]